jgi:hypothetical protein
MYIQDLNGVKHIWACLEIWVCLKFESKETHLCIYGFDNEVLAVRPTAPSSFSHANSMPNEQRSKQNPKRLGGGHFQTTGS